MPNRTIRTKRALLSCACSLSLLAAAAINSAAAQTGERKAFAVPAQPAAAALNAFAAQADATLVFSPDSMAGIQTGAVNGAYTPEEALQRMLEGTGLVWERTGNGALAIVAQPAPVAAGAQGPASSTLDTVMVTGTRIKGGATASPLITIGSENIREEGFADLGEVIRSVSQNHAGGQNPGVANGAILGGGANFNYGGGSALNLRGLGPDATLTLLNGRRLAYDGPFQAVDISAIPVEAVERIEVMPDGASAIYGSDAVGGVANVILKRDFDGLTLGARYGTATEGGMTTREYTATGGLAWATGGLIATWKKSSTDAILADQRDYTGSLPDPNTLYPEIESSSGLLSIYQSLGEVAELRLDALKSHRDQERYTGYPTYYYRYTPETSISLLSPSVEFRLPSDWSLTVGGTYGKNDIIYKGQYVASTASTISANCYCNESRSYEVGAEGRLFALGGGDARLALGVGTRTDDYLYRSYTSTARYGGDEGASYAYGEINLPLVSPALNIAGVRRLEFSVAVRGEDYDSFGRVTTPKFGVIYDPNPDFTLKASWGKSFKAPTLYQRYLDKTSYLYTTDAVGGSGYASDATVLVSYGGNDELKAERARTWSASLVFHPEASPGLQAELTWFDIDYTDRVVRPIPNFAQALSHPSYAEFVSYSATAEEQVALLSAYSTFYNYAGIAYDPSKVVAIIRDEYVNAAQQRVKGVDLSGSYRFELGAGRMTLRGAASWLDSVQQNTAGQPEFDVAGTIFQPAKFNGRVGAVWTQGGFSVSSFATYIGGVASTLVTGMTEKTSSFTTVDATLRYDLGERDDGLSGLEFALSAQNLFNRTPPLYTTTTVINVPYDSTNYSAIGRFLSVSVSKHW